MFLNRTAPMPALAQNPAWKVSQNDDLVSIAHGEITAWLPSKSFSPFTLTS